MSRDVAAYSTLTQTCLCFPSATKIFTCTSWSFPRASSSGLRQRVSPRIPHAPQGSLFTLFSWRCWGKQGHSSSTHSSGCSQTNRAFASFCSRVCSRIQPVSQRTSGAPFASQAAGRSEQGKKVRNGKVWVYYHGKHSADTTVCVCVCVVFRASAQSGTLELFMAALQTLQFAASDTFRVPGKVGVIWYFIWG